MTKTYEYEGVQVDLRTRRELARLEGVKAEAEGWVRHYQAEMEIRLRQVEAKRAVIWARNQREYRAANDETRDEIEQRMNEHDAARTARDINAAKVREVNLAIAMLLAGWRVLP